MEDLDDEEDAPPAYAPDTKKLRVEVSVSTGGVSNCVFTSLVEIPDWTDTAKAAAKLRDVAKLLRSALPFEELKGEEATWHASRPALALDKEGKPLTRDSAIKMGQEELRKALSEEKVIPFEPGEPRFGGNQSI